MNSEKKPFLFDAIFDQAESAPDAPAFYVRHRKEYTAVSHREVLEKTAAVRALYLNQPWQRIGWLGENSADYFILASGLMATGKTIAFLDSQAGPADLAHVIDASDLDAVLYDEATADIIGDIRAALAGDTQTIAFTPAVIPDESDPGNFSLNRSAWTEGDTLFYTSGTSKSSKVVVTPTRAIVGNIIGLNRNRAYAPGEPVFMPTPYFHSFGFTVLYAMYGLGCPIIVSSMKTMLKDIGLSDPVQAVLVPSALDFLLKKGAVGPRLKYLLVSGSYLSPDLAGRATCLGIIVQNQYGSSEVPTGFASNKAGDPIDKLTVSDAVRIELSAAGEVYVHTDNHFTEYYKNPEDTAEMLVDGVVHSGDLGYLDEDGCLHLLGRRKNMILMENGDKVFYTDLDEALNTLPEIDDAAVIYADQMLIAAIAPAKGVSEAAVRAAITAYNATQPVSRIIRRVWIYGNKLPYTSSGKLARSVIEKEYATGAHPM